MVFHYQGGRALFRLPFPHRADRSHREDRSRSNAEISLFLPVAPLILLPLLLAGCQVSPMEWVAPKKETPSVIFAGDKGSSILARKKRLLDASRLPRGLANLPDALPDDPKITVRRARFTSKDSAFGVLKANGVSHREISKILRASRSVHPLSRIGAGNRYELVHSRKGVRRFVVQTGENRQLRIYRSTHGAFRARMERIPYEVRLSRLGVVIRQSFLRSTVEAGGTPQLAMELGEIFEWVIDFHKDLRKGDRLKALVERRFLYGRPAGFGRILSAKFSVGKITHEAVYFDRGQELYYTPQGNSLRRGFLRSPLKFTRISSRFTRRRYHPILKRFRPHLGVDYAAPKGTPVRAVADGTIKRAGWKGASGKMVGIRHDRGYTTGYFHLSGFAKGMRPGKRVAQGQVIGYVGSTGLSTGPHLDFRIKRFGEAIDPLSAKIPAGKPVSSGLRSEFRRIARMRNSQLRKAPLLNGSAGLVAAVSKNTVMRGH